MTLLTQSDWAKRHGFTRQYVHGLVKKGTIPLEEDGRIDADRADVILEASRDHSKEQKRKGISANMEASDLSKQLLTARIKNEKEKGKILEMKAKTEAGEYISVDAVEKRAFDKARMVRDHLLNIPDRIAPMLLSISDEHEVHSLLTEEIRLALEGLCDE